MKRVVLGLSCVMAPFIVCSMEREVKHAIGETVLFGENETVKKLEKEPLNNSMVIIEHQKYDNAYQWAQVRNRVTSYGFMIIYQRENKVWSGNAFRLSELYELVQKET